MSIGKYSTINYADKVPPAKAPASLVFDATLDGTARLVGEQTMLFEFLATNTMGSLGKIGGFDPAVFEFFVAAPLFNQHPTDLGSATFEEVATANFGIYGAGGGALDIYDEGVLIVSNATHIDIVGADSEAVVDGTGAIIYHPPPAYPSHFNTNDGTTTGTVNAIATSARYVSAPTVEGTPFYTGGGVPWGGDGSTHAVTRTSPLTWTPGVVAGNLCLFEDQLSTITVTLSDSSGVIETHTTAAISANTVSSSANITVNVTNWAAVGIKYQGNISVTVDIDSMLPAGGYFDLLIRHFNGGTNYDYSV